MSLPAGTKCICCGNAKLLVDRLAHPAELALLGKKMLTAYLDIAICSECGFIHRFVPSHLLPLLSEQLAQGAPEQHT